MTTLVAASAVATTSHAAGWLADNSLAPGGMVHDLLAQNNFGDTRSGGLAGPLGLFIIVLLAIATVLLIRNMNGRLKRLPERFPPPEDPADRTTTAHKAVADEPDTEGGKPAAS